MSSAQLCQRMTVLALDPHHRSDAGQTRGASCRSLGRLRMQSWSDHHRRPLARPFCGGFTSLAASPRQANAATPPRTAPWPHRASAQINRLAEDAEARPEPTHALGAAARPVFAMAPRLIPPGVAAGMAQILACSPIQANRMWKLLGVIGPPPPRHRRTCERPQQGRRQQGKHRRGDGRCPRGSRARRLLRAEFRPEQAGPGETASAHLRLRRSQRIPPASPRDAGSGAQLRNPGRHAHTGAAAAADGLTPSARCALLQRKRARTRLGNPLCLACNGEGI